MAERWELVELIGQTGQSASRDKHLMARQTAEAILDEVEPLIRAEARAEALEFCCQDRAADLHARVEALPTISLYIGGPYVRRSDVFDLIDRSGQ